MTSAAFIVGRIVCVTRAMAASVGEVDLDALVNLDDFERAARAVMDAHDFDYFAGAAESETTMRANAAAFSDVTLWPKCLVDVSDVDISASFPELGLPRLAAPLIAAPVAMQKMAHPAGESAAARACAARRVGYCASQQATTRVETIAEALETTRRRRSSGPSSEDSFPPPPMWFQLYVFEDRSVTKHLIERAEKAGVAAFAVTVDAPVLGRRERDVRNRFAMRAGMKLENVFDISSDKAVKVSGSSNANAVDDDDTLVNATRGPTVVRRRATVSATTNKKTTTAPSRAQKEIARRVGGRDASLTWRFLEWIKSVTDRPIILKGVTRRDDAAKAVEMGVDALWVSNHGGRQLDGAPATLDALPEVVAGARSAFLTRRDDSKKKKKVPVVFDGGVRRGVDVLKALALGADLVAFGRPLVWGLACGGEEGVDRVIEVLLDELKTAAALCGVQKLDDRNAFLADVAQRRGDPPPGQKRSRL